MTWAFGSSRVERSPRAALDRGDVVPPSELSRLAVAAAGGDRGSFDDLVHRMNQLVRRYCRSRLGGLPGGVHSAEDAAQEACLNLIEMVPEYRPQEGPFEALLYTIASRRVADQQRTAYRAPVPVADIPDDVAQLPTPEERAVAADEASQVRRMLLELPPLQREVLTLRVAVGMTADEVAAALEMTPGAVRVAQHRALNRLRAMLATEQEKEGVDA